MGCPVHIWVPLMAATAPVVRVAKGRFVALRYRGPADPLEAAPVEATPPQRRWAPIDPHGGE